MHELEFALGGGEVGRGVSVDMGVAEQAPSNSKRRNKSRITSQKKDARAISCTSRAPARDVSEIRTCHDIFHSANKSRCTRLSSVSLNDWSANLQITVRVVGWRNAYRNLRVLFQNFVFDTSACRIDDDVRPIPIKPERGYLRGAVRQHQRRYAIALLSRANRARSLSENWTIMIK